MHWQCMIESASIYRSTCDVMHYVCKLMEWSEAASATVGSAEYFGTEKSRRGALAPLPPSPLLLCHPLLIIFQSQHEMEGKANMILSCPYQNIVQNDIAWM